MLLVFLQGAKPFFFISAEECLNLMLDDHNPQNGGALELLFLCVFFQRAFWLPAGPGKSRTSNYRTAANKMVALAYKNAEQEITKQDA